MTTVTDPRPNRRKHQHGAHQAARVALIVDGIRDCDIELVVAKAWDHSPGPAAASLEPHVAGSSTPRLPIRSPADSTGVVVIAEVNHAVNLDQAIDQFLSAGTRLLRQLRELTPPDKPPVERRSTVSGCLGCGRIIGTAEHPSRGGLCDACRKWVDRRRDDYVTAGNEPPDRQTLIRERTRTIETMQEDGS